MRSYRKLMAVLTLTALLLSTGAGALEAGFGAPTAVPLDGGLSITADYAGEGAVYAALYDGAKLIEVSRGQVKDGRASFALHGPYAGGRYKLFALDGKAAPLSETVGAQLAADYSGADLSIDRPGVYTLGRYRTVTISPSVGDGSVTLDDMELGGDLLIQGGGSNTVCLTGGTAVVGTVRLDKTGGQPPRLLLGDARVARIVADTTGAILEAEGQARVETVTALADMTLKGLATESLSLGAKGVDVTAQDVPEGLRITGSEAGTVTLKNCSAFVEADAASVRLENAGAVTLAGSVGAVTVAGGESLTVVGTVQTVALTGGLDSLNVVGQGTVDVDISGLGETELSSLTVSAGQPENVKFQTAQGQTAPTVIQAEPVLERIEPLREGDDVFHVWDPFPDPGIFVVLHYSLGGKTYVIQTRLLEREVTGFDTDTPGDKALTVKPSFGGECGYTIRVEENQGPAAPRRQVASSLYRVLLDNAALMGAFPQPESYPLPFSDCAGLTPMERQSIAFLNYHGVMRGLEDGSFAPEGESTRATLASLLCHLYEKTMGLPLVPGEPSPDVEAGHWAHDEVGAVQAAGLMGEREKGRFQPDTALTQAELKSAASALARLCANKSDGPVVEVLYGTVTTTYIGKRAGFSLRCNADVTYQWYVVEDGAARPIEGATENNYSIVSPQWGDQNKRFYALVKEERPDGTWSVTRTPELRLDFQVEKYGLSTSGSTLALDGVSPVRRQEYAVYPNPGKLDPELSWSDFEIDPPPSGLSWSYRVEYNELILTLEGQADAPLTEPWPITVTVLPGALLETTELSVSKDMEILPLDEETRLPQLVWAARNGRLSYAADVKPGTACTHGLLRTRDGVTVDMMLESSGGGTVENGVAFGTDQAIYELLPGDVLSAYVYPESHPERLAAAPDPLTARQGPALTVPNAQVLENPVYDGFDIALKGDFAPGLYAMEINGVRNNATTSLTAPGASIHLRFNESEADQLLNHTATLYHLCAEETEEGVTLTVSDPIQFVLPSEISRTSNG